VGGKPSTNEKPRTNERMICKWESLRGGWACPWGGLWVSVGAPVGESRPRILSTNKRMDDVQMGVVSGWGACPLRQAQCNAWADSEFWQPCPCAPSTRGCLRHGLWRGRSRFWRGRLPRWQLPYDGLHLFLWHGRNQRA